MEPSKEYLNYHSIFNTFFSYSFLFIFLISISILSSIFCKDNLPLFLPFVKGFLGLSFGLEGLGLFHCYFDPRILQFFGEYFRFSMAVLFH